MSQSISFHIEYSTRWGDQIYLYRGTKPKTGDILPADSIAMNNDGRGHWFIKTIDFFSLGDSYHYLLVWNGHIVRTEWGNGHHLNFKALSTQECALQIFDGWQQNPEDKPFFSSAFTQSIFSHTHEINDRLSADEIDNIGVSKTITWQCEAATIRKGQVLAICGNAPALGNWDISQAPIMDASLQPIWSLTVNRTQLNYPILYKFVILDEKTHHLIAWESGCDRYFDPGMLDEAESVIVRNLKFINPQTPWRGAGVAIPVFSLRSQNSCGIGEFQDLKLLVDWAEKTHQSIIQILPVNDTTITRTWKDSYPYNSNSSFALNPMYINLRKVGILADSAKMEAFAKSEVQLNRLPSVDYDKVLAIKWDYLKQIYEQNGANDMASPGYLAFYERNRKWLNPYAVFCYLRDKNKSANYNEWKESRYSLELVNSLLAEGTQSAKDAGLYMFIQYHLHLQLLDVRDYAHAHGIVLKGDIPIGISRYSVDAWANSHLFNLDSQAGAPPDAFDKNGQNWGFPTYNWRAMAHENYAWFKERFVKMSDYFDAYRIDHILGFFRIWEVPIDAVQGLLGHFNPALPLTPEEMKHNYGFLFDAERHLEPFISDESLESIFTDPETIDRIKNKFLNPPLPQNNRLTLKPRFCSQRGIEGYFKSRPAEDQPLKLKLFQLTTEVLFVEDPVKKNYYHPRINGIDTESFKALTPAQQKAYEALHFDFFYRRHNDFWREEALKKLPVLAEATQMLICGEDLGMIPDCVPEVMNEMRILSLEIQRMPKGFEEFGDPLHYPYYSVCTTSSHDLSNIRAWWEEDPEVTQRYFTYVLKGIGDAPKTAEPWICAKILEMHLSSPSLLAILPLQDWLSINEEIRYFNPKEERINVPSNPNNYWRYRMHLYLEDLLQKDELNRRIEEMIKRYDR